MEDDSYICGLDRNEASRYSRQVLVNDFGVQGQKKVFNAKVLIVGAGGLGCPVGVYLAGAGIGTIGLVDYDTVAIDNLHRQIAHREDSVGTSKVESLRNTIKSLNSNVTVITHEVSLNRHNAIDIFSNFDIVCDCSDNVATRYLTNDVCVIQNKPLVSGSALRWDGQLSVYHYGETGPCYRCLFPNPPDPTAVTNCSEGGVLGPIVGVIGSMQALEVLKIVSGVSSSFAGKLYLFDGKSGKSRTISLRPRSAGCLVCGDNPTITSPIDYEQFCGAGAHDKIENISLLKEEQRVNVHEYREIRKLAKPTLLDTRPPLEFAIAYLPEAINVTLDEVKRLEAEDILKKLDFKDQKEIYVICHRGNDSQRAVQVLEQKLSAKDVKIHDVIGGYEEWSNVVNPNFPRY